MRALLVCAAMLLVAVTPAASQVQATGDSVSIRLADTDFRFAVQVIGRFLVKPVLLGNVGEARVQFFQTPRPIPRSDLPRILEGLAQASGLVFEEDSTFYRIQRPEERASAQRSPGTSGDAATGQVRLSTFRLRHARAGDVAATLNQLYGGSGSFARASSLGGTLADGPRPPPAQSSDRPADADGRGVLAGDAVIVPDELTNSLLIRSTEGDYQLLSAAIQELDVRPLQVLIEVIMVEARKDRAFALSFGLELPPRHESGSVSGEFGSAGLGDLAGQVMGLGRDRINASLAAARSRGDVEILSRPVLLASNNTEAELMVGTQQPFVAMSRSLPTDVPQRDQVVQYRDVGTRLVVRPTINYDGYVSLSLHQEMSATTGQTQFDAPVIASRQATTQVLVADGQTIVIGGLVDKITDRVKRGVPLLVDIPVLGALFGSVETRTTETELFLFITPTIIADDADADAVTAPRLPSRH